MKRQIQCGRSRHALQYAPLRCSAATTQAAILRSHRRQLPAVFHFPGRLCRWPKKKTRRRWRGRRKKLTCTLDWRPRTHTGRRAAFHWRPRTHTGCRAANVCRLEQVRAVRASSVGHVHAPSGANAAGALGSPSVPRAWCPFVLFPILVRPCVRGRRREASRRVNFARFDAVPLSNRCGALARRPIWRPDGRQSSRTGCARGEAGGLPVREHHGFARKGGLSSFSFQSGSLCPLINYVSIMRCWVPFLLVH